MKTTQRLYEAAYPIWEQCHAHPFVRGIVDGSLDLEKFQWFLLQDYLYLFDYARVFAYGVVKARDPELMRTFSANVDAILGGEMKVHRAYMARLGITEEQVFAVQPALSNLSYTHYMLSCAAAGGPAEIIAAILSCSWSYAEIGQRLAAIPGAKTVRVLLRREDAGHEAHLRAVAPEVELSFAEGKFELGGMIIEFPMQHRRADLTFDTALEDLSSRFTEITGFGMEDSDGK